MSTVTIAQGSLLYSSCQLIPVSCFRAALKTLGKSGKAIRNLGVAETGRRKESHYTMNANEWKQTFSFSAPEAHSVLLAGDFTRWLKNPIPLRKQPDGVWRTTASLKPGTYHYRFVVDGEWRDDPECTVRVQNPLGTQNDVIQVGNTKTQTQ
jgi:1,4-alpha-glucan branching enzyme